MIVPVESLSLIAKAVFSTSDELLKIGVCMTSDRFDEKDVIQSLLKIAAANDQIAAVLQAIMDENPPLPTKPPLS